MPEGAVVEVLAYDEDLDAGHGSAERDSKAGD
jgi:hypothetical protein